MKKAWKIALIAILAALAAWMLWPRNLGEAFDTEESIAVSATIFGITDGQPDNTYETYELDAGSEQGKRLGQLLEQHTYHPTLSGLMGDDTLEDITVVIHLFNGKGQSLTLAGGTKELLLEHRVCGLDYWGADRGTQLCEAILSILREP